MIVYADVHRLSMVFAKEICELWIVKWKSVDLQGFQRYTNCELHTFVTYGTAFWKGKCPCLPVDLGTGKKNGGFIGKEKTITIR